MPDFSLELLALERAGILRTPFVAGIDEVGMVAIAGPIVAAAVVLVPWFNTRRDKWYLEIDDSKKLSPKKRGQLYSLIIEKAQAVGIGWAPNMMIDADGVSIAHRSALVSAFSNCRAVLGATNLVAVVDGEVLSSLRDDLGGSASVFTNKADSRSYSVAAASIIAKVERDFYMTMSRNTYKHHGFETHKGYATAKHLAALREHGVTSLHRRSFEPLKSGNFPRFIS